LYNGGQGGSRHHSLTECYSLDKEMFKEPLKVLMITGKYPSPDNPHTVPFIARQVRSLKDAGVDVDVFHYDGRKKLSNYVSAWRRLREHAAGKTYDVVHAQWGQSAVLALPKRMPMVITFRGNDLEGIIGKDGRPTIKGEVQRFVSHRMAAIADEIIVVSESLGRHIDRDHQVIPSGLDLNMFRPMPKDEARQKLYLPTDKPLILFAASTLDNPRKRYDLARQAVDLINDTGAELIVANNVPHSTIPDYMNACDALLLTSVHEGSPNVVKEALACNLPIVSVDVGDVAERVAAIDGCVICKDDTPASIANGLKKVLERSERINGVGAVRDLSEDVTARKVIEVYEQAIRKAELRGTSRSAFYP
jgi:teichuronic acid biosynthesis glycosyltransferase TuaC